MSTTTIMDEKTPVRLGLLLGLIGGLIAMTWGASSLSTKVDSISSMLNQLVTQQTSRDAEVQEIKARVRVLEQIGSPKAVELERRINEVEKNLSLHAQSKGVSHIDQDNLPSQRITGGRQ